MSEPCVKSDLDLIELSHVQAVMDKGLWTESYPISALDGGNTIEVVIPASLDEYINVHETLLSVTLKVTRTDGSAVPADEDIVPIDNMLDSLFSDIILTMNEIVAESSPGFYPFKSGIINQLYYSEEVNKCQLRAARWEEGGEERKNWFKDGKSMELTGPLHLDFFHQSKYLLSGVSMRIKFVRSRDDFVLIECPNQKVVITMACLFVRKVRVNPAVLAAHEENLAKENAIYPIQHTDMTTYTIPTGASYHLQEGLLHGQLPKLVIVGMVASADFSGGGKNTALLFNHFGMNQISLQQDGQNVSYSRAIEMDWTSGKELVTRAYMALFQNLEILNINQTNGLTLFKFMKRWTLFAFNLTPDLSVGGECGQPYKTANLRLEIKFITALKEGVNVVVMGIHDGRIEISKQRQVFKTA